MTVQRLEEPVEEERLPPPRRGGQRLRPILGTAAWPALILSSVLVVQHHFAFGGLITNQHEDVLSQRLPDFCFLGRSLAAHNIPNWNPHVLGGVPFAADPQSGWMNVPAMAMFGALPCDVAIRWYIVLLPILAGLGLYWFLRMERLSGPAAGGAGLVIALMAAGSWITLSLPFSGTVAWTCVMLGAAATCLAVRSWGWRLLWALGVAAAWGQLAAAHLSNGLVIGSGALGAYLVARLIRDVARRDRSVFQALAVVALLAAAIPLVNLAVLLPRLSYLGRSTLDAGYGELQAIAARLRGGTPPQHVDTRGLGASWPLGLAVSPGSYAGAVALALIPAAFRARRHLHLAIAFAALGAVTYLATLRPVALWAADHFGSSRVAAFYLHDPVRFRYGTLVALAILAGLGIQAWRDARSAAERAILVAPGVVIWWVLPFLVGRGHPASVLFFAGMAAGAVVLAATAWRRSLVILVPVLLAAELVANGLGGQAVAYQRNGSTTGIAASGAAPPLFGPTLDASAYLRPTQLARVLEGWGGRYMTLVPRIQSRSVGYIYKQRPAYWGMLANQRATLFGLEDAQGYNAVQPIRFWEYMRVAGARGAKYNMSFFTEPSATALDLLSVTWLIGSAALPPAVPDATPVFREGRWELFRLRDAPDRASLLSSWQVADSPDASLGLVTASSFDPERTVVLEEDPALGRPAPPTPSPGTATYERLGAEEARVLVRSPRPAIVLVRNSWDPNWRATVDGRPARVLVADHFLLGIPVPAGRHEILLAYSDPTVRRGVMGSGVAVLLLLGAAGAAFLVGLLRRPRGSHRPGAMRGSGRSDREPPG